MENKKPIHKKRPPKRSGKVRIIGGLWRGRIIHFPPELHVRPTPDRVRETLFNWLANNLRNTWCLDLFAGTGALGFEALSRGASRLTCIDHSFEVIKHLKKTAQILKRPDIEIINADIPYAGFKFRTPFDIVFIDPPFYRNLVDSTIKWLEEEKILNPGAIIYIEHETGLKLNSIPTNWHLLKNEIAGQVNYQLFQKI